MLECEPAPWPLNRGLVEESARWYNLEHLRIREPMWDDIVSTDV